MITPRLVNASILLRVQFIAPTFVSLQIVQDFVSVLYERLGSSKVNHAETWRLHRACFRRFGQRTRLNDDVSLFERVVHVFGKVQAHEEGIAFESDKTKRELSETTGPYMKGANDVPLLMTHL